MPTISVNGTTLWYERVGSGLPMVFLHGGLGLDHSWFRPWVDPLAAEAELVFYDMRGNGRSERRPSLDDVTHDTWVDDVAAFTSALGLERFVLVGHSYGSLLAQLFALHHPRRLTGLVLVGSTPAFDFPDVVRANAAARGTRAQQVALERIFGAPMKSDEEFQEVFTTLLPLYFHRYAPDIAAAHDRVASYSAVAYNRSVGECLSGFDTTASLARIDVPTLLLSGDHDWITPPAQGLERLRAGIAGATAIRFAESGHFPFIEEQPRFLDATRAFLRALPRR